MCFRIKLWLKILIIIELSTLLQSEHRSWTAKQQFPAHMIPDGALSTQRSIVKRKIVLYHNFFRSKVRPTASNMLAMTWHEGAAQQAQSYAERCIFLKHVDTEKNTVPDLGQCGQNLFVSLRKAPWFFALKSWFLEYKNFTYGHPEFNLLDVGHYTQMVWATTHKVGCGIANCTGGPWGRYYNYVCHYCPSGNILPIVQYPYKIGKPCSDCKEKCSSDALCTNACHKKDFYSNCDELTVYENYCKTGYCNATCDCGNKSLHKNYPWT